MGKIARTWDLMGQSLAILKSDKELLWLPICSTIACIAVSVTLLSGAALVVLPQLGSVGSAGQNHPPMSPGMWAFLLFFYLVNYFVVIFFNVALVAIASDRLGGGHATLNDGLEVAWQRKFRILEWAAVAATVGILLRAIENRSRWLGRLVAGLIGVGWTLATFFIVPLLAAEDIGPGEAMARSASLFRENWGEEVVGGFSFGLVFGLLGLPALILPFYGSTLGQDGYLLGVGLAVTYWLMLAVINSTVQGIFMAALYRYATTKNIFPGFRMEDMRGAWQPRG